MENRLPTRVQNPANVARNMKDLPLLSSEQIMAPEMIIQRRGQSPSYEIIAKTVNVSPRTLARWRNSSPFCEYIRQRALIEASMVLPAIMSAIQDKAMQGNVKAAELVLKSLQLLSQTHAITVTPVVDSRSTESIENEIAELKRELGIENEIGGFDNE